MQFLEPYTAAKKKEKAATAEKKGRSMRKKALRLQGETNELQR